MNTKSRIRCAAYTRKSTEEGLDQIFNSLDAQREACEAYIASQKAEGWICLPAKYDDGGFSGGTLERPALQKLLVEIERGEVDVVVVYKIDRLSRSLMDFAKLVEIFDRKSVTFVSVTQSFNTTTSVGRLTLNVLLSFAQFEREVTGERIRDKFAASKKKGMWMGGNPPLGYDVKDRKLIVNEAEAATVNLIFKRYLELGAVRELRDDLDAKRIVSKAWTSTTGQVRGGQSLGRGALYCLLKNRIYVGEISHKGEFYPGEHRAIVPGDLFDAVQTRLESARRRTLGKKSTPQGALLAGILVDEEGTPMVPTYSKKPDGRRYRYYASRTRLMSRPGCAAVTRVPAAPVEDLVTNILGRVGLAVAHGTARRAQIRAVQIAAASIAVRIHRAAALQSWQQKILLNSIDDGLDYARQNLLAGEQITDEGDCILLTLPVRAQFRGGRAAVLGPPAPLRRSQPDGSLIKALARAHRWMKMVEAGHVASIDGLAAELGQERRHAGRTITLASLAPEFTAAILEGRQPSALRLTALLNGNIPVSWREQRILFGAKSG